MIRIKKPHRGKGICIEWGYGPNRYGYIRLNVQIPKRLPK